MKKLILILPLLVLLIACGSDPYVFYSPKITPYMENIAQEFDYEFNVIIVLADKVNKDDDVKENGQHIVGTAYSSDFILIRYDWFNNRATPNWQKEAVILHELGHYLGMDHVESVDDIMHFGVDDIAENEEEYINKRDLLLTNFKKEVQKKKEQLNE